MKKITPCLRGHTQFPLTNLVFVIRVQHKYISSFCVHFWFKQFFHYRAHILPLFSVVHNMILPFLYTICYIKMGVKNIKTNRWIINILFTITTTITNISWVYITVIRFILIFTFTQRLTISTLKNTILINIMFSFLAIGYFEVGRETGSARFERDYGAVLGDAIPTWRLARM